MSTLPSLRRQRGGHRACFTSVYNEVSAILDDLDPTVALVKLSKVKCDINFLSERYSILRDIDKRVLDELCDSTDCTEEQINDEISEAGKVLRDNKLKLESLEERLNSLTPDPKPVVTSTASTVPMSSSKLPRLQLLRFDGSDIRKFSAFWDVFMHEIDNKPLDPTCKFRYLMSLLDGKALDRVKMYRPSADSYASVCAKLKKEFGDAEHIKQAHIDSLTSVAPPSSSIQSLRKFYDAIQFDCGSLNELGLNSISYGSFVVPMLFRKLPNTVQVRLFDDCQGQLPGLEDFLVSLERELRKREDLENINEGFSVYASDNISTHHFKGENSTVTAAAPGKFTKPVRNFDAKQGAPSVKFGNVGTLPHKSGPSSGAKFKCFICSGDHNVSVCSLSIAEKMKIVQGKRLCYNCLGSHSVKLCRSKFRCAKCARRHHTVLHDNYVSSYVSSDSGQKKTEHQSSTPVSSNVATMVETAALHCGNSEQQSYGVTQQSSNNNVLLKTAKAKVVCSVGLVPVRVLFDEGSQTSYVSRSFADKVKLPVCSSMTLKINSFGGKSFVETCDVLKLDLMTTESDCVPISAIVVPTIVNAISQVGWKDCVAEFSDLPLADQFDSSDFEVDMLIGLDQSWKLLSPSEAVVAGGLVAQRSPLGYVISGISDTSTIASDTSVNLLTLSLHDNDYATVYPFSNRAQSDRFLHESVQRSLSLDDLGVHDIRTDQITEAKSFVEVYKNSITYSDVDKQYSAPLPWKDEHPTLQSNLKFCFMRLKQVSDRLKKLNLFECYADVLREHLRKGFIEAIPEKEDMFSETSCHYLSHFFVLKDGNTTTPLRIVFAGNQGSPSLNSCLETGPCLLNDSLKILLAFRVHRYAFVADIAKAFLCIRVDERDRNYLRFLWYEDGDPCKKIISLRYRCVAFGMNSSPFVLHATVQKHLDLFDCPVTRDMKEYMYVDNLVSGCPSEEDAIEYYHVSRSVLGRANMHLRQWLSNSSQLMDETTNDKDNVQTHTCSVLGMIWKANEDVMCFPDKKYIIPEVEKHSQTKRSLLSIISSLFDPYGYLQPVTMPVRLLISTLWDKKYSWDETLPIEIVGKFAEKLKEVQRASEHFSIPRWYEFEIDTVVHLHCFTDASFTAFGCVIYAVQNTSRFVISKSKLVPRSKSGLTIPKLELMAMVLGARLLSVAQRYLQDRYTSIVCHGWTDSEICLFWINETIPSSKIFVRNRVREVNELTRVSWWSHVPSDSNPADILSRGCDADRLQDQFWLCGPSWLGSEVDWPPSWKSKSDQNKSVEVSVMANHSDECSETVLSPKLSDLINPDRFSTYHKLLRTMAYVIRFVNRTRRLSVPKSVVVSALEIKQAESLVLKVLQREHFVIEVGYVKTDRRDKKPSLVRKLNLVLVDDLLCAAGRFRRANVPKEAKFPILLPKNSTVTRLIVEHFHTYNMHSGVSATLVALRREFWLPSGRSVVKRILRSCVPCRYQIGKCFRPPEQPPLQSFRLNELRPYSAIGIDFCGPLYVRNQSNDLCKVYLCIFSCCTTRNINIEVVEDMSVETFLLAFRAHCADFSYPRLVISDNAQTFRRGGEEVQTLFNVVWSSKVRQELGNKRVDLKQSCEVKFTNIPIRSPHWGGFYERMVGIVKTALKKVLGKSYLRLPELRVLLKEIRSSLNDRPLTYIASDDTEVSDPLEPLTPSLLLYGYPIRALPHPSVDSDEIIDPTVREEHVVLNRRAKFRALLYDHFFQRFCDEYFPTLRERHATVGAGLGTPRSIRLGDVCLLVDKTVPRGRWKLGVVDRLLPDTEGVVRAVELRTAHGKTNRAIKYLVPLEVLAAGDALSAGDMETTRPVEENQPGPLRESTRTRRQAALQAEALIREQL